MSAPPITPRLAEIERSAKLRQTIDPDTTLWLVQILRQTMANLERLVARIEALPDPMAIGAAPRPEMGGDAVYAFDRYRPSIGKMAEGVSVHARSLDGALSKAGSYYTDPEDSGTTFRLCSIKSIDEDAVYRYINYKQGGWQEAAKAFDRIAAILASSQGQEDACKVEIKDCPRLSKVYGWLDEANKRKNEYLARAEKAEARPQPDGLRDALEATAEALNCALERLGVCGEGDGPGRNADADSWGGTEALRLARAALAQSERGN